MTRAAERRNRTKLHFGEAEMTANRNDPLSELLFDPDFARSRKTSPSKRWRNRWRIPTDGLLEEEPVKAGHVYWSKRVWPSREIAEAYALETVGTEKANGQEWLGAFPEEAP